MKKIQKPISKEYKIVHLYLDDIENIETVILQAKPRLYKITLNNYEYDNVKEIPRDTGSLYDLEMQTYEPYVSLQFRKYGVRLYVSGDDLVLYGIFSKIDKILEKSERKLLALPTSNIFFSLVLGGLEGQLIIRAFPLSLNFETIIFLVLATLLGLYLFLSYSFLFRSSSVIETIYRREKHSFFTRNKDQLILVMFGALIGAVITVILERLFLR